jgi:hypothetical protein
VVGHIKKLNGEYMKISELKQKLNDGWHNIMTGLFNNKKSKHTISSFTIPFVPEKQKWNMYTFDPIVTKIVDLIPKTSLKAPIELIISDLENGKKIHDELDNIKLHKNLIETWRYARLFGGGVWIPDIIDGRSLNQPVNYNNIRKIEEGVILSLEHCYKKKDDEEYIYLYNSILEKVHISRCIVIEGINCSNEIKWAYYKGFGASLLDSIHDDIHKYHLAHEVPPALLIDYSKPIFKIEGLNRRVGTVAEKEIIDKLDLINYVSSITSSIVLDINDNYERVEVNASNLDKLVYQTERKLCALTHIPHTLLLNEAPEGGLSNNNKQQQIDFYDFIEFERNNKLTSNIKKILFLITSMLKIKEPVDFKFANLFQLDKLEEAKVISEKSDSFTKKVNSIIQLLQNDIITLKQAQHYIKLEGIIEGSQKDILNEGSWS